MRARSQHLDAKPCPKARSARPRTAPSCTSPASASRRRTRPRSSWRSRCTSRAPRRSAHGAGHRAGQELRDAAAWHRGGRGERV